MGKKLSVGTLLIGIFIGLFTLAVSYAFIPTFFPELAFTPAAWAYTAIAVLIAALIVAGLLWIKSLNW